MAGYIKTEISLLSVNEKAAIIGYHRMGAPAELIAELAGVTIDVVEKVILEHFKSLKDEHPNTNTKRD